MQREETELKRQRNPKVVPFTEADSAAWQWTLKAGLSPERADKEYGFRWIPSVRRVFIPLVEDGKNTGAWISRSVDGRKPKYVASLDAAGKYWIAGQGPAVVVEDVLSGIAVSRAGYRAIVATGTAFDTRLVNIIANERVVYVWLDSDKAGDAGWTSLRKKLSPFGVHAVRIRTDKDPKAYSAATIRSTLDAKR